MKQAKILALILAGGAGSRMELLTEVRAKPTLPFAGSYRLIDFPLSNCVHSRIADVWVIEQFQTHSINEHLMNGRPWDLDRTYGGLRILPPHQGTSESGWHQGNADAIYRNRRFVRDFAPDLIVVLSADHVYKLDYRDVIAAHQEQDAAVTIVTTQVKREEATRFGNVITNRSGQVTQFAYKPDEPISETVTTEVFVYNAHTLLDTLDELAAQTDGDDQNSGLKDFGHQLLPQLVDQGRAYAYPLDGYWRDMGTIESYFEGHMDWLGHDSPFHLDDPAWPILTFAQPRMAARIGDDATITNSLIAPGCTIRGRVVNSILGPGVVVEAGTEIRDTIIFNDTTIGAGATIRAAIIDERVRVGEHAQVGSDGGEREITLVGQRTRIEAGTTVAAGERVPPRQH